MTNINLIQILRERELIKEIINENILLNYLKKPITLYCGFDPTADSLHLGHIIPLLCLRRFQLAGHRPIILIGGATSLVGDPSFRSNERKLHSKKTINQWIEKIKIQISIFLDFNCGQNSAILCNNLDWFNTINIISFLRKIGKYFYIKHMINKESVKQRLNKNNMGISFTEFSYSLLQGYDFLYLYKKYKTILQIGGSDQLGNIISGIHLTNRLYQKNICGLTLPLITKSDGTKFSKTDQTTIWLDPQKTSPYQFYQFWLNINDMDVYKFLKFFTFLSIPEINALQINNTNKSKTSSAQYILAEEITRLVHGKDNVLLAKHITKNLFKNLTSKITENDFIQLSNNGIPVVYLDKSRTDLPYILVKINMVKSRKEAQLIIKNNSIEINKKKQILSKNHNLLLDILYQHYTLIRKGKKKFCLIYWK